MEIAKAPDAKLFPELRAWLKDTQYRQTDLARFLGVTDPTISRYLSGENDIPPDYAIRLALLTGIPPEKLVADPETARILKLLGKRSSRRARNVRN